MPHAANGITTTVPMMVHTAICYLKVPTITATMVKVSAIAPTTKAAT